MILSLTKNEIIIKPKKAKFNLSIITPLIAVVIIIAFLFMGKYNDSFSGSLSAVFNPVNSLYNDNSGVIFTSGNIASEKLDFSLPVLGGSVENNNGNLEFTIGKSIMIRSIESGVVLETGTTLDGIKYIKIKHNENIYSILENVDIIGVAKLDSVKKGQDIATGKEGEVVTLKIFENDIQLNSLEISQSKIIWQN